MPRRPGISLMRRPRVGAILPFAFLALATGSCGEEIVEPPPAYGIVTGRVMDDNGQGIAGAVVTIALDPTNRMPAPGEPHLVSVDTVSTIDGTFGKTVLMGGLAPFDAVVTLIASATGFRTDSVTGSLQLRTEEPYDRQSIGIFLQPK